MTGITGKSGASPARFRHCNGGESLRVTTRRVAGEGEAIDSEHVVPSKPGDLPTVQRQTFCGEQKACAWHTCSHAFVLRSPGGHMSSIVTTRGDGGETSLAGGIRVSKASLRVDALGAVDELNAALGFARAICEDE